jgi:hypothetical protein
MPDQQEDDEARLDQLEGTIARGLGTFLAVGRALREISDRRLYRFAGFKTFADYVDVRWDMSRAHAYRQIDAVRVVDALGTDGPVPTNEAQARELVRLNGTPDELRRVWRDAIDRSNGRVTARVLHEVVAERVTARDGRPSGDEESASTPTEVVEDHGAGRRCPRCGYQLSGMTETPGASPAE